MKAKSKPTTKTTRKPLSNCAALLQSVRQELRDMGIGDDVSVDGGDAVEYLGKLLPDIGEALERDGVKT
jgi:hypothetical protein